MSQDRNQKITFATLLVTLGIIYGDIGTSPLYVLKAIVGSDPINNDIILGGISAIFWTLTLQTTIKYVIITLRADNNGEGGIFALYALVSKNKKRWLIFPALIGGATLLADGIITPPISVSSAIEGLRIIPQLSEINTIPIIVVILTLLFIFQQFGTHLVGKYFGPIMLIWFSMLFILGIYQVALNPEILKAINPYYFYHMLVLHPDGFWLLGAVFLCTTGAEALYSDLGHCGRDNIRISWGFVKTALMFNYMGQGAYLLKHNGELLQNLNPFYVIMPEWFLLTGIIISTFATIVASQALISGSFTLINEAMRLNFWPKVKVNYPTNIRGQLYIPSINWLLYVGCLGVVFYFQESSNMEAAYGLAIVITMLMTTTLLFYFMKLRKFNKVLIYVITSVYFIIEFSFFIANSIKFSHGGWVTLLIGGFLFLIFNIWYNATLIKNKYVEYTKINPYLEVFKELSNDKTIAKFSSNLIYLTSATKEDEIEVKIVYSLLQKQPKRFDVLWLIHIEVVDEPYTMEFKVIEITKEKIYKIIYYLGFRVEPRINLFFRKVVENMVKNNEINIKSKYPSLAKNNLVADFRFVIFKKYFSYDNEFPSIQKIFLDGYKILKKFSLSEEMEFGLDTSSVVIENIPLILSPVEGINLVRIYDEEV